MAAALLAELRELLGLVTLAALANEVGVGIVGGPRLGTLAADDAQPLLREVLTRKMVGQVGGREEDVPSARASISGPLAPEAGLSDATPSSRACLRHTGLIVTLIPSALSFSASWSATSPLTTS